MIKVWCRRCLTVLNKVGLTHANRQLSVSSWFSARDYVEEGSEQQTTRWLPKKRLTRYQMDYLRTLRAESPELWTLKRLSKYFGISYISVVKILKSKFQPSDEVVERQDARAMIQRDQRKQKKISSLQAKKKEIRNAATVRKNIQPPLEKTEK